MDIHSLCILVKRFALQHLKIGKIAIFELGALDKSRVIR